MSSRSRMIVAIVAVILVAVLGMWFALKYDGRIAIGSAFVVMVIIILLTPYDPPQDREK